MLGVGHARAVVADAIDQEHPGFYGAVDASNPALTAALNQLAMEIWNHQGGPRIGGDPAPTPAAAPAMVTDPGPAGLLVTDDPRLTEWLRGVEIQLDVEMHGIARDRPAAAALLSALPDLCEAYWDGTVEVQQSVRRAFSRFRRVLYILSGFAGMQLEPVSSGSTMALRNALVAEAILDLHTDWRDELLLLRDLRKAAGAVGLPFADLVQDTARRAGPETATFLLGVLAENA